MRIALMLRSFQEKGGVGVYTRYLVQNLLQKDHNNTYLLFYNEKECLGTHHNKSNAEEYYIPSTGKFIWDQISVPYFARKHNADLVFNPKFSLPLISSKKSIVVQHGADWFLPDYSKFYKTSDIIYNRIFIPLYCKKADYVISVSEFSTDDFIKYVKVPPEKIKTIYFGPADFFKRVSDNDKLLGIKKKYNLPDKFILTLSRYGFGGGNRKNIRVLFEAYKKYSEKIKDPVKIVVGGKNVENYISDFNLSGEAFLKNVQFTGWMEQEDLPAVYSSAELFLYPSNLETFPIPLTEAMACGTPIITSDVNGLKEIAGNSALFVNNKDPENISAAIIKLLNDSSLRLDLSSKGLSRSRLFSWNRCTEEILQLFQNLDGSTVTHINTNLAD